MPILTVSMEWLSKSAWSFLGHVVSRATDTVLTFSGASARIYQRSGGLPPLSHSLVHLILRVPAINTSPIFQLGNSMLVRPIGEGWSYVSDSAIVKRFHSARTLKAERGQGQNPKALGWLLCIFRKQHCFFDFNFI